MDVDADDGGAGDCRILHGEVAEAADPDDADQVGRSVRRTTLTALYVVTPAQVSGAASIGSMPSGTVTAKLASATAYSA